MMLLLLYGLTYFPNFFSHRIDFQKMQTMQSTKELNKIKTTVYINFWWALKDLNPQPRSP